MKRLKKGRIFLGALIISVLIIAGCTTQSTKPQAKLRLGFFDDIRNRQLGQALVDAFNKSDPAMQVKMLGIASGGQYRTKLLTMISGGTAPDLMVLLEPWMADYASREVLLNLQPYMENDKEFQSFKEDIYPSSLKASQYEGIFYSAPFWTDSMALFYNKDIFDKEGISYPDSQWDLDKLLSVGKKLTKDFDGDGRIDQYAFFDYFILAPFGGLYTYIKRNDGQLFSEDGSKCLIDTPKSIEAIAYCFDLINKYHISPSPLSGDERLQDYEKSFLSGRVAMTISGRWSMPMFSDSKNLRWAVAPQPQGEKVFKPSSGAVLAVSGQTKYPKECWEFLKFIMGEEAQKIVCDVKVDIPVRISVANSPLFLNKFSRPADNRVFLKEMEGAEEFPCFVRQGEWFGKAGVTLELVIAGKKDLKTACQEIAQEYEKIRTE